MSTSNSSSSVAIGTSVSSPIIHADPAQKSKVGTHSVTTPKTFSTCQKVAIAVLSVLAAAAIAATVIALLTATGNMAPLTTALFAGTNAYITAIVTTSIACLSIAGAIGLIFYAKKGCSPALEKANTLQGDIIKQLTTEICKANTEVKRLNAQLKLTTDLHEAKTKLTTDIREVKTEANKLTAETDKLKASIEVISLTDEIDQLRLQNTKMRQQLDEQIKINQYNNANLNQSLANLITENENLKKELTDSTFKRV